MLVREVGCDKLDQFRNRHKIEIVKLKTLEEVIICTAIVQSSLDLWTRQCVRMCENVCDMETLTFNTHA